MWIALRLIKEGSCTYLREEKEEKEIHHHPKIQQNFLSPNILLFPILMLSNIFMRITKAILKF